MPTRGSVETANDNNTGANDVASDAAALPLRSIARDDADQRVYNFAVQSLSGEAYPALTALRNAPRSSVTWST